MIIYKVTNFLTKKIYIGKTSKSLDSRKKEHLKNVKSNKKTKFYNAIRKYGDELFLWEILTVCENEETLNKMEIFFITDYDSFKNGYNSTLGGDGGDTISMKSKEQKKNQGAKKGNIPWNKGADMKKLGYTFYVGRKSRNQHTEEEKNKLSFTIKNSKKYREGLKNRTHGMSKKVIRENDNKIWNTIKECSEEIGVEKGKVRYYILNSKPLNNFVYKFLDV